MNKEFEENGDRIRLNIPTQEAIDEWKSKPPEHYKTPPAVDMVAEMWAEHNRIEEERKLQLELDL